MEPHILLAQFAGEGRRQPASCPEAEDRIFIRQSGCMQEGAGDGGNKPVRQRMGLAGAGSRQADQLGVCRRQSRLVSRSTTIPGAIVVKKAWAVWKGSIKEGGGTISTE